MSTRRMAAAMIAALLALLVAATGCGNDDDSGSGSRASDGDEGQEFALIVKTLNQPVWRSVAEGVKARTKELGIGLTVDGGSSEEDVQGQINKVEDQITQGVDALLVAPNGTGQLKPILQSAIQQDIPVVLIDTDVPGLTDKTTLVVTDNKAASKEVSGLFAKELGGKGVAGFLGYPNVSSVEDRVSGTEEVLAGTDIDVVAKLGGDCDQTKALNTTSDMLQAHPDITAIFGHCGNNATGAIQAIKTAGKTPGKDVKVIGFDGTELELQAIEKGELFASVAQDFQGIGAKAVDAAAAALADKPVDKEINVPTTVITKENVADFK